MAAGVGGLFVDGGVDELDEGFEQFFQLGNELPVGQGDGRLGGQGFGQALVRIGEGPHFTADGILGVDQLQDADDLVLVVLHGHREKGLGAVAGAGVEGPGAGEVEALRRVGVGDVDRLQVEGAVGGHHGIVGLAAFGVQRQVGELGGEGLAAAAAKGNGQGVGADNLEAQMAPVLGHAVEGAAVRVGDLLGSQQDALQQAVQVALVGEGRPDLVELLQAPEKIVQGIHALPPI